MEAEEILQRLADKYSHCRSYSDCGIVDFLDVKGKKDQLEFRTRFQRGSYFSFEWQDYGPRRGKSEDFCILWSQGHETYVRYPWGIEQNQSLQLALAGVTGCSAGAASIVPRLLMEEMRADAIHLLQMRDLRLLRREVFETEDCYVLQGTLWKNGDHVVWVSTKDFNLVHVYDDRLCTAEESRREHERLLANKELMVQLAEKGIPLPEEMKHVDRIFITEYTFRNIVFDDVVVPLPCPKRSE